MTPPEERPATTVGRRMPEGEEADEVVAEIVPGIAARRAARPALPAQIDGEHLEVLVEARHFAL